MPFLSWNTLSIISMYNKVHFFFLSSSSRQTECIPVIIVGHSECGGVLASVQAVQSKDYPKYGYTQTIHEYPPTHPLNRWLAPLTKFVESLGIESMPITKALPIAVEANIIRQVENLSETAAIQNAWKEGKNVSIYGWIYELATGRLRDLGVGSNKGK
jgi:carbonic anhydrase